MIELYGMGSPNVVKIYIALEEVGLPYNVHPVDVFAGKQFDADFLKLNPMAKVPVIVDSDGPGGMPLTIFESGAILLYLAEKTGRFLPANTPVARGELLSWLMFVASGIGPYSGQAVHFKHFAPEPKEYPQKRYDYEAQRHWGILEERLAQHRYMLGDTYTIVDMAVWGWARALPFIFGEGAWETRPSLKRLVDEISARPAGVRAGAIKDRFTFKTENDEEARRFMFPTLAAMSAKA